MWRQHILHGIVVRCDQQIGPETADRSQDRLRLTAHLGFGRAPLGIQERHFQGDPLAPEDLADGRHGLVAGGVALVIRVHIEDSGGRRRIRDGRSRLQDRRRRLRDGRPDEQIQNQNSGESDYGDDRLHHGPDHECLFHAHVVVLLEHPESDVVEVREHQASGGCGDDQEFRRDAAAGDQGKHDASGGDGRNRSRTQRESKQCRHAPGEQNGREVHLRCGVFDRVARPAIQQHLFESAAGGYDQDHHRHASRAGSNAFHEIFHISAAPGAERVEARQHGHEECNVRIAQEFRDARKKAAGLPGYGNDRARQHQYHRYERGEQADTQTGQLVAAELARRVQSFRGHVSEFAEKEREHRPGQQSGRRRQNQTVEQCQVGVGLVHDGDRRRRWVRRQIAVCNRQRRRKRNSQVHQRQAGGSGQSVNKRNKDQKTRVVDHRQADDETGNQYRQLDAPHAEQVRQSVTDGVRGAALLDKFPEDCAENQNQHQAADGVSDALQNRFQGRLGGHAVQYPNQEGNQNQRKKGVEFPAGDQQQKQKDRQAKDDQGHTAGRA